MTVPALSLSLLPLFAFCLSARSLSLRLPQLIEVERESVKLLQFAANCSWLVAYKMRRKTFIITGLLSLFTWILILGYLFYHQPILKALESYRLTQNVNKEMEQLERSLKEELIQNEQLLSTLRRLEFRMKQTGKDIHEIIQEDPEILDPNNRRSAINDISYTNNPNICILVFACNRVTVRRSLDQLLKYRPANLTEAFPIIVSQDCGHQATKRVIKSYNDAISYIEQPDQSEIPLKGKEKKMKGYYKIARHYKWALSQVFNIFNFEAAIIVEDDLDISEDFYEYFTALYPILKADDSLWCVSAWNDNGKVSLVSPRSPHLLYRSDFFPGLGWMLTKEVWQELEPKWPKAYWDDWIRQPDQRKNRACIRPELSRTRTFGKIGVSNGLFYEKHLKFINLNSQYTRFTAMNLTYLLKNNYDIMFLKDVYSSTVTTASKLIKYSADSAISLGVKSPTGNCSNYEQNIGYNYNNSDLSSLFGCSSLRITYKSKDEYKKFAKMLGLMEDFKSGVPRTGYLGIVSFIHKGLRVFLAPPSDWPGYDTSWT